MVMTVRNEVEHGEVVKLTLPWIRVRCHLGVFVELLHLLRNYDNGIPRCIIFYL